MDRHMAVGHAASGYAGLTGSTANRCMGRPSDSSGELPVTRDSAVSEQIPEFSENGWKGPLMNLMKETLSRRGRKRPQCRTRQQPEDTKSPKCWDALRGVPTSVKDPC